MTYGYKKPHITFLDRPTKYTTPLQEEFRQKWLTRIGVGIFCCLVILGWMWLLNSASAQDGLQSSRPQGFFGQGHEGFHGFYNGLKNARGGSCCNDKDCRPTTAKWNDPTQTWAFMVDGKWRILTPAESFKVITAEIMIAQKKVRPINAPFLAHICTNPNGSLVYCFIPSAGGG